MAENDDDAATAAKIYPWAWRPGKRKRKSSPPYERFVPGAAPGSFGDIVTTDDVSLDVFRYDAEGFEELELHDLSELTGLCQPGKVVWLDVTGIDSATLEAIAAAFDLHALAVEDAVLAHQRAKVESYAGHDLLIARTIQAAPEGGLRSEQVSFFLGDGFLVTVQELKGDPWEPARERLRAGGRLRSSGPDYLLYALLDAVVDYYFPLLHDVSDRIEDLEDVIIASSDDRHVSRIHTLRRELIQFRRSVWPLREVLLTLSRGDLPRFQPETRVFLRDTQDHVLRVLDLLESYREMGASLMDLHLSVASQRMNEIMKVLTVISTIFIPLSFIAGLYGMNFDPAVSPLNMPETKWAWGYPFSLALMAAVALALVYYFRRRGWLVRRERHPRRDRG
ncbi:MAG: magnesium/cobalt transporter CorA [Deltaproteobacteria bacterium]|nr:magnesium/cobalt transporter CorA [Deltaproteobacteria bacterium]